MTLVTRTIQHLQSLKQRLINELIEKVSSDVYLEQVIWTVEEVSAALNDSNKGDDEERHDL